MRSLRSRIAALSLFSDNESLEDISTTDLVYLLVPYTLAEAEGRVRTVDPEERIERVARSQVKSCISHTVKTLMFYKQLYRAFVSSLETYGIVPEAERDLQSQAAASVIDAQKRRELKIRQYQKEKEIKTRIQVCSTYNASLL